MTVSVHYKSPELCIFSLVRIDDDIWQMVILKKKILIFFGITDPGSEAYRDSMSSVVILSCQPNSHPFQERHISLLEPVKIGRSVARARPQSSNGIFDCKVLSRNHAVVWYENGKVSYMFMYYLLMHLVPELTSLKVVPLPDWIRKVLLLLVQFQVYVHEKSVVS